jgi:hypothetical protein
VETSLTRQIGKERPHLTALWAYVAQEYHDVALRNTTQTRLRGGHDAGRVKGE